MNALSVDAFASATKPRPPSHGSVLTFFKALLMLALLSGGLAAGPADAGLLITTTGRIASGSETGGLFGLPTTTTSLVGQSYTLIVEYDGLGPSFFAAADGSFALDSENSPGMTGYVTAIVNGRSLTTSLTNSLGSALIEDLFDFAASNQGHSGASGTGAFVNVLQNLSCNDACVPRADLNTSFSYALGPFDFGTDLFTFQGAGFPAAGTPTASFTGVESRFAFAVPEPDPWVLLAVGLVGFGMLTRRRASA